LDQFVEIARTGALLSQSDYKPYADRARKLAPEIKVALHFTIKETISDVQIIHQLLSQMGLRFLRTSSRKLPGYEGQMQRCYRLDLESWNEAAALLARRQAKRDRLEALAPAPADTIHPPDTHIFNKGVDRQPNSMTGSCQRIWRTYGSCLPMQAMTPQYSPTYGK
jgi:hypothetical protein